MQLSNTPGKLLLPFAASGAKNAIPVDSQVGIVAGKASLQDGFPPLTRTPLSAGGVPPSGLDMNGILFEMSAVVRWANAGGGYAYDEDFATDSNVGGYPKGARVMRSDGQGYWFNTVENNTTDPEAADAAAEGWVPDFTTGAAALTMTSTNVTLTAPQYGKPIIVISGILTANLNLIFPALPFQWVVINKTTGNYTITCKTAAGAGVVVIDNETIIGDGVDILSALSGLRSKVNTFSNVAALRLNKSPEVTCCATLGYHSAGDGGQGFYYVDAADTTTADDGFLCIVDVGARRWKLNSVRGTVNVLQAGADPTGTIDNTAIFVKVISTMGTLGPSVMHLPAGQYKSLGMVVDTKSIHVMGDGKYSTRLLHSGTSDAILFEDVTGGAVSNLGIFRTDTATGGGAIVLKNSSNCSLHSIYLDHVYDGFVFNGGQSNKLWDFEAWYVERFGIYGYGPYNGDIQIRDGFLNGEALSAAGLGTGVRLVDKNHAFNLSNVEIINFDYPLSTDSTGTYGSWTIGYCFAFSKWHAVYFDSCTNGALFEKVVGLEMDSCWFSNRPNTGLTITEADGVAFTGGSICNSAKHGASVGVNAKRVSFNGVQVYGNGTAAANTWAGLAFAAGCSDFSVTNCVFANTLGMGTQKHAVQVQTGASDRYLILGNLMNGMGTSAISDGGTGANKYVANNIL